MQKLLAKGAKILEIKVESGQETHRNFPRLANNGSQIFFEGKIGPILSFIAKETGWSIDVPKSIDEHLQPRYFEDSSLGSPYRLDVSGWDRDDSLFFKLFRPLHKIREFKLADSPHPIEMNIVIGRALQRSAIRYTPDDRRLYKDLMRVARGYLKGGNSLVCISSFTRVSARWH